MLSRTPPLLRPRDGDALRAELRAVAARANVPVLFGGEVSASTLHLTEFFGTRTNGLKGLVIGVQQGNTSQPVADKLVAEHRAARVRVYAYDQIEQALDDLSSGGCDAFMKLAPVTAWYVRDRPKLKVVETGITVEHLGICVRKGNVALRDEITKAQAALKADGTLAALIKQWLGVGATLPA